ncbi:hypothetical protein QMZ92_33320 [Streptomyces sp. HNM0645]|uniref:hypothetical protein n=1 Tax=Streptomyces sp. HNM0645 TaxID=2782343 RepID=UPI0024B66D79|nr:hypothetical protein [Streptomyces sp. HNM0645]MDI9889090.1 hypothetical protein [Streptomyces sp. HNM0645]
MDDAALLAALPKSLAGQESVYSSWCRSSGADLASHVHDLAKAAEADCADDVARGATGPTTVEEIEAALHSVPLDTAVELMTNLSADSLVFPGHARRDRAHAMRAAMKAASILGPGAQWFSNIDGSWGNGRSWEPVTRHTFDGVVAGRGGGFLLALLQVGED